MFEAWRNSKDKTSMIGFGLGSFIAGTIFCRLISSEKPQPKKKNSVSANLRYQTLTALEYQENKKITKKQLMNDVRENEIVKQITKKVTLGRLQAAADRGRFGLKFFCRPTTNVKGSKI